MSGIGGTRSGPASQTSLHWRREHGKRDDAQHLACKLKTFTLQTQDIHAVEVASDRPYLSARLGVRPFDQGRMTESRNLEQTARAQKRSSV